jgi:D-inositol-3-phosphate glycosyltransferase
MSSPRIALVGPGFPHRGGIAQYTTMLYRELSRAHAIEYFGFSRLYPGLLFPGRTQLDESGSPLQAPVQALLDSLWPPSWFRTAAAIDRFNPDLTVLAWWHPFFAPSLGTVARRLAHRGRRTAFLCHNVAPHEASPLDRLLTSWAFSRTDAYIVHAQSQRADLEALRSGARVLVSPHPTYDQFLPSTPQDPVEARRQLGIPGQKVLLFFGLIRPYKGLDTLLEAFRTLASDPELCLVIAGECYAGREALEESIRQLGPRVILHDRFIPNEQVATYFAAADLVVLPYHSASQSGVVQIAYACDRPVLVTRVGGLPEVVEEGRTGLLVPAKDPLALVQAVHRFYSSGGTAAYLPGIAATRERFSWGRMGSLVAQLASDPPKV